MGKRKSKNKSRRHIVPKEEQKRINKAVTRVIEALLENDCLVHRLDAFSSCSVYLKVDAGIACSIRISNHPGYEYLHYRFNYLAGEVGNKIWEESYHSKGLDKTLSRIFYQSDTLEQMIQDILQLRSYRMKNYMDYEGLIERELEKQSSRFWENAYCVNELHEGKRAG